MQDINIAFCRSILKAVHADVKAFAPEAALVGPEAPWVYNCGGGHWEMHGPGRGEEEFYWHGRADNAYDARAKGWSAWLRWKGAPEYRD